MNDDPTRAIADEVLSYLARHPDAADTAEGIQRWWLADGGAYAPADVEHALERLARGGAVTRRRLPDDRVLYAAAIP
jgi:DNA-binding MarR family transcriptional regulator